MPRQLRVEPTTPSLYGTRGQRWRGCRGRADVEVLDAHDVRTHYADRTAALHPC